jgi:hypothetical protein
MELRESISSDNDPDDIDANWILLRALQELVCHVHGGIDGGRASMHVASMAPRITHACLIAWMRALLVVRSSSVSR